MPYEVVVIAVLNLADSLMDEFAISEDMEILDEIMELAARLNQIAEENCSFITFVDAYFLIAKLEFIKGNIKAAIKNLIFAQEIAQNCGFTRLLVQISTEHDIIIQEGVSYHENPFGTFGDFNKFAGFFNRIRHRFLHQHMFSGM